MYELQRWYTINLISQIIRNLMFITNSPHANFLWHTHSMVFKIPFNVVRGCPVAWQITLCPTLLDMYDVQLVTWNACCSSTYEKFSHKTKHIYGTECIFPRFVHDPHLPEQKKDFVCKIKDWCNGKLWHKARKEVHWGWKSAHMSCPLSPPPTEKLKPESQKA